MVEIFNDLIRARFGAQQDIDCPQPATGVHAQLLGHRSRRRYKSDPIPTDTLDLLLACALSAPAKSDLQQISVINFADPSLRDAVTDLMPSMPWIKEAPVFLLFCGDGRRIKRICEMRGTEFAHNPLDAFLNAAADAAIVMQNFIVAAEAEGLGCCPISAVREVTDEIADLADLPEDVFPFVGLCLGYPDDDPWISMRLPLSTTVHTNKYDDSNLAEDLDAYDAQRRAANPYRNQRDQDTFGSKAEYGWTDDKARQTTHTDRLSFVNYVKKKVLRTI